MLRFGILSLTGPNDANLLSPAITPCVGDCMVIMQTLLLLLCDLQTQIEIDAAIPSRPHVIFHAFPLSTKLRV